jgi:hypothetical protein
MTNPWELPDEIKEMKDVERANRQLHNVYSLYNGYMQISLSARNEILESRFIKTYAKELQVMREQISVKDAEIETLQQMVESLMSRGQTAPAP